VSADENKLFGMLLRMHLSPRVVMLDCGIRSKETFDWVVDQVRTKFYASLASPAEMVGVIAAQSIGEPATQLTLNSVDWRTELLLSVDGVLRRVEIGNFVDECVSISEEKDLEAHGNRTTLAWINRPGMPVVKVLSPDEDGKVAWQVVEAVTQHPPINEDGSRTLIKVTTATGREVIATKAKSFLIRKGNKLVASRGDELRVDDHLPVSEILPLPREATGVSSYGAMPLNEEFGSFMGAYAAGGCCVEHAVLVANLDATYIDKIRDFCDAYSIEYHMGESNTIRMHSPALAQLVLEACGTGAANKRVPVELFGAPAEFKKAFIDAYFSRGACVSSASRGLLEDISNLLVGFDIRTSVRPTSQVATGYVLDMDAANSRKFAQFAQRIEAEQERTVPRPEKDDVVPGVNLDAAAADVLMSKSAMRSMLADDATPEGSKGILRAALDQDVFYDKIVKIEEVESPHEFVYDLTVENTRTFQTYHGLGCYDTFHLAGVSAASKTVRGVPRLKELLSVSKNMKTPIMRVHFKPEDKASSNACLEVMNKLQTVRLRDIARRSKILYDPNNRYVDPATGRPDKEIVDIDRMFDDGDGDGAGAGCDDSPWVLRIELDNAALRRYNLDMIRIKHHIQKRSDVACAASDSNGEHLLLRVKIVDSARGASKKSASDVLSELKALESYLLESFVLQGVPGLEKFTLAQEKSKRYDETTQTYEDAAEWVAFTEGTNLARMLGHPRIDSTRLYTNNVREALEVLGVEAARQTMYIEIQEVLESITVNYRHLALLVDVQTNKGQLLSIDRHGINRGDIGPLAKCSFEETTDKLIKAGIFSEVDKINGVSANIMLGQVVPAGTGTVSLVMNNRLAALAPPKNANAAPVPAANADFCHEDAFDIAFELPAPRASAIAVV
jgi:DNA-directed RNA polymerase beta' subunit